MPFEKPGATTMHQQPSSPFSAADWETFNREDRSTTAIVVATMTAIFLVGLVLYVTIAWLVAN
jgi:hypothetical protein